MTSRTVRSYKIHTTEVHKCILEAGGIYALIILQQRLLTSQENLLQALQGENLGLAPESSLRLQNFYTFIHKAHRVRVYDITYSTYLAKIQLFFPQA